MTSASRDCLRQHIDVIAVIMQLAGFQLLAGTMLVQLAAGGITQPSTDKLYLKSGDKLRLVCEQKTSPSSSSKVVWFKANTHRVTSSSSTSPCSSPSKPRFGSVPEVCYQTIDTSVPNAPYTINQEPHGSSSSSSSTTTSSGNATTTSPPLFLPATDRTVSSPRPISGGGVRLVSELVKEDVTPSDSGYYRCRLGKFGISSTVLVTVVNLLTRDALSEKVNNDTDLLCTVVDQDGSSNYSVTWYRHGEPVGVEVDAAAAAAGQTKYSVRRSDEGTWLRVARVRDTDVGLYHCGVTFDDGTTKTTLTQVANLFAYPHIKSFDRSVNIVAGHRLVLICRAWGWPTPNVTWYRNGVELTPASDRRVWLGDVFGLPPSSRLTVEDMGSAPGDRAHYSCVAATTTEDMRSNATATVLVRVKGKLAALWPLLGLGLEVIILCVIIVVYEMQRNKQQQDDVDQPDGVNACDKSKMAAVGNSHQQSNAPATNDRQHNRRRKENN